MTYMLLIYFDERALSETERVACYVESAELAQAVHVSGQYLVANPLHPTAMATSVRVRAGKRLVTDGPFAEIREQMGGYFLINAMDLDEAIAIAARIPMARKGTSRGSAGDRGRWPAGGLVSATGAASVSSWLGNRFASDKKGDKNHMYVLLERFVRRAGIAGVQPAELARIPGR